MRLWSNMRFSAPVPKLPVRSNSLSFRPVRLTGATRRARFKSRAPRPVVRSPGGGPHQGSVGIVPPEDNLGWSGRHPADCRQRGRTAEPEPHGEHFPAATDRRPCMFEPLGDAEKKTTGRTMRIIWIVIAVVAVILAVISFA